MEYFDIPLKDETMSYGAYDRYSIMLVTAILENDVSVVEASCCV